MTYPQRFSTCLNAQTNQNSSYCSGMQQASLHKLITEQLIRKIPRTHHTPRLASLPPSIITAT